MQCFKSHVISKISLYSGTQYDIIKVMIFIISYTAYSRPTYVQSTAYIQYKASIDDIDHEQSFKSRIEVLAISVNGIGMIQRQRYRL